MTRIGYKVVRRTTPDHFASVLAPIPVAYKLHATSRPEEASGPLCLFADMDLAVRWASKRSSIVFLPISILRCEYQPWDQKLPRDTADAYSLVLGETGYKVRPTLVWQGIMTHTLRLPAGTRLAKSITPLEVVHEAR